MKQCLASLGSKFGLVITISLEEKGKQSINQPIDLSVNQSVDTQTATFIFFLRRTPGPPGFRQNLCNCVLPPQHNEIQPQRSQISTTRTTVFFDLASVEESQVGSRVQGLRPTLTPGKHNISPPSNFVRPFPREVALPGCGAGLRVIFPYQILLSSFARSLP